MTEPEMCHCGRPLHYLNSATERQVKALIRERGEYIPVVVGNRRWKVPRHYIALHGLKGSEVPTLGFEEITD